MLDTVAQLANMVATQLRTNDVTDARVLHAMGKIPRERFVPQDRVSTAYMEGCVDLGRGRRLIDPRTMGKLLQLADIGETDTVLDAGCATGYSTAVLAQLAAHVLAVESDGELCGTAAKKLTEMGIANARVVQGSIPGGYAAQAPYDVIFLNGAIEIRPDALLNQLKEGGRLVAVVRDDAAAHARLYLKHDGVVGDRSAFDAQLSVLPGFEKATRFVF